MTTLISRIFALSKVEKRGTHSGACYCLEPVGYQCSALLDLVCFDLPMHLLVRLAGRRSDMASLRAETSRHDDVRIIRRWLFGFVLDRTTHGILALAGKGHSGMHNRRGGQSPAAPFLCNTRRVRIQEESDQSDETLVFGQIFHPPKQTRRIRPPGRLNTSCPVCRGGRLAGAAQSGLAARRRWAGRLGETGTRSICRPCRLVRAGRMAAGGAVDDMRSGATKPKCGEGVRGKKRRGE